VGSLRANNYGENLAMGTRTWQQAIKLWSSESSAYNWNAASFQGNAGHLCVVCSQTRLFHSSIDLITYRQRCMMSSHVASLLA